MDETDLNQIDNSSITKTHEEILEMLEEIKEFEKKYGVYETDKSIIDTEFSEIEYVNFEEIEPDLVIFKEIKEKKANIIDRIKNLKFDFKKLRKKEAPEETRLPKNPTTFRLRINEKGVLENIDFKKPQPKKKIKINLRRKNKKEKESSEGKSKFGKIISGFNKIKRIIPKRGKEEESETEESETSNNSE
jgi:hypothetical protein